MPERLKQRFGFTEDLAYELVHHAVGVMQETIASDVDYLEAREAAAQRIKSHRGVERPVTVLTPGWEWELEEADDEFMVPDSCGILTIRCCTPVDDSDGEDWAGVIYDGADDAFQEEYDAEL